MPPRLDKRKPTASGQKARVAGDKRSLAESSATTIVPSGKSKPHVSAKKARLEGLEDDMTSHTTESTMHARAAKDSTDIHQWLNDASFAGSSSGKVAKRERRPFSKGSRFFIVTDSPLPYEILQVAETDEWEIIRVHADMPSRTDGEFLLPKAESMANIRLLRHLFLDASHPRPKDIPEWVCTLALAPVEWVRESINNVNLLRRDAFYDNERTLATAEVKLAKARAKAEHNPEKYAAYLELARSFNWANGTTQMFHEYCLRVTQDNREQQLWFAINFKNYWPSILAALMEDDDRIRVRKGRRRKDEETPEPVEDSHGDLTVSKGTPGVMTKKSGPEVIDASSTNIVANITARDESDDEEDGESKGGVGGGDIGEGRKRMDRQDGRKDDGHDSRVVTREATTSPPRDPTVRRTSSRRLMSHPSSPAHPKVLRSRVSSTHCETEEMDRASRTTLNGPDATPRALPRTLATSKSPSPAFDIPPEVDSADEDVAATPTRPRDDVDDTDDDTAGDVELDVHPPDTDASSLALSNPSAPLMISTPRAPVTEYSQPYTDPSLPKYNSPTRLVKRKRSTSPESTLPFRGSHPRLDQIDSSTTLEVRSADDPVIRVSRACAALDEHGVDDMLARVVSEQIGPTHVSLLPASLLRTFEDHNHEEGWFHDLAVKDHSLDASQLSSSGVIVLPLPPNAVRHGQTCLADWNMLIFAPRAPYSARLVSTSPLDKSVYAAEDMSFLATDIVAGLQPIVGSPHPDVHVSTDILPDDKGNDIRLLAILAALSDADSDTGDVRFEHIIERCTTAVLSHLAARVCDTLGI